MKFSVGAVPFINALPLIYGLESDVRIQRLVPSQLPPLLASGEAQAIMVSSIEALRTPNSRAVASVGIASFGTAASVRLFSRVPWNEVKTLGLDSSSMTSNALAQIWLYKTYGIRPNTVILPPDLEGMLDSADAAVLIGDKGMTAAGENCHIKDMGDAWTELTGLPFVWALWTGNETLTKPLADRLRKALDEGLENLEEISQLAHQQIGISVEEARDYFTNKMAYRLDERFIEGLATYGKFLKELNLVEDATLPEWV